MRIVIALGGNALLPRRAIPDARIQLDHIRDVAPILARVGADDELILTHGNGPQVGLLAVENSNDLQLSRPYPFDALVAETQGLIGYWLQQAITSAGHDRPIVTLVTQTVVAPDDPAFAAPTKFIGSAYTEDEARRLAGQNGWTVGRDGAWWRRTVASPLPLRVVEAPVIEQLVQLGTTVICAGGGGCPVIETDHGLEGAEAVIDKDRVAAQLAIDLEADLLLLVTDVAGVYTNYGTPDAELLGTVTPADLARLSLAAGSMGPKVEAALRFAHERGKPALIGALEDLDALVAGRAGTRVCDQLGVDGDRRPDAGPSALGTGRLDAENEVQT